MKLEYWYAAHLTDNRCYSIVAKTRKEAKARRDESPETYGTVVKRTIVYDNAFDLFEQLTGEDGGRGAGSGEESEGDE